MTSEYVMTTEQLSKIQSLLIRNESFGDELNEEDEVIKMILELRNNAEKVDKLEAEKLKLITDADEIQQLSFRNSKAMEKKIENLQETIEQKEIENSELKIRMSEHMQTIEKYEKFQEVLSNNNNETISEDCFDDNFGKFLWKLHQTASRSESLENEKLQLLNEIAEIRHDAEILTEKLMVNQTLSETEMQLREKIETLEAELKDTKEQLSAQIAKNNEYESKQLDLEIKIEEVLTEKDEIVSQITQLMIEVEAKTCNVETLESQLTESASKIISYEQEISHLTFKLDEIKAENEKQKESISDYVSKKFSNKIKIFKILNIYLIG